MLNTWNSGYNWAEIFEKFHKQRQEDQLANKFVVDACTRQFSAKDIDQVKIESTLPKIK